jgi:hypothetical protein
MVIIILMFIISSCSTKIQYDKRSNTDASGIIYINENIIKIPNYLPKVSCDEPWTDWFIYSSSFNPSTNNKVELCKHSHRGLNTGFLFKKN